MEYVELETEEVQISGDLAVDVLVLINEVFSPRPA